MSESTEVEDLRAEVRRWRDAYAKSREAADSLAGALRAVAMYGTPERPECWGGVFCGGESEQCAAALAALAKYQGEGRPPQSWPMWAIVVGERLIYLTEERAHAEQMAATEEGAEAAPVRVTRQMPGEGRP